MSYLFWIKNIEIMCSCLVIYTYNLLMCVSFLRGCDHIEVTHIAS